MSYFQKTFQAVGLPLTIIQNDNLSILEANPAFVRLTGFSPEELRLTTLSPIIEHCSSIRQLRSNSLKSFTLMTKRRKRVPVTLEVYELEAEQGGPAVSAIAIGDLRSSLWLKQQCDGDQVLLSGVVDASLRITFLLNPKPFNILDEGYISEDETILQFVGQEEWPKMLETIQIAVKLKQARSVTIRSTILGAVLDMNITFQPIFDGFGKVKEYAFVLHDVRPVDETADSSVKLKIWMAKRDINASQLAAATGISPQTISKLRNGKIRRPQRLTAELIASELQVDMREIWKDVRN